jgi:hypothetical protein
LNDFDVGKPTVVFALLLGSGDWHQSGADSFGDVLSRDPEKLLRLVFIIIVGLVARTPATFAG